MKLETLKKKLESNGLSAELLHFSDGNGGSYPVVAVRHDYVGFYPTAETWETIRKVDAIARRAGLRIERRGYYQATVIY